MEKLLKEIQKTMDDDSLSLNMKISRLDALATWETMRKVLTLDEFKTYMNCRDELTQQETKEK